METGAAMVMRLVADFGAWTWCVLGLVLLLAEIIVPGVFLMWIGIAALIVGGASLALWQEPSWVWQTQCVVFAVLAVVVTLVGRRYSAHDTPSDQPLLNRREEALLGRTARLDQPIVEGRGRIRLDGTAWPVEGPDMAAGSRVQVTGSAGGVLRVESAP